MGAGGGSYDHELAGGNFGGEDIEICLTLPLPLSSGLGTLPQSSGEVPPEGEVKERGEERVDVAEEGKGGKTLTQPRTQQAEIEAESKEMGEGNQGHTEREKVCGGEEKGRISRSESEETEEGRAEE